MNIGSRINARKIVLSYFYQICFFQNLSTNDTMIDEVFFIDDIYKSQPEKFAQERANFFDLIQYNYLGDNSEDEIMYIVDHMFDQRNKSDIDFDYIIKIVSVYKQYQGELIKKVNKFTQSFQYNQMDIIDQAMFLLGYVEWKELKTPKEILLNEMIEISKRYSDDGSPKLLNGIMHNIISEI